MADDTTDPPAASAGDRPVSDPARPVPTPVRSIGGLGTGGSLSNEPDGPGPVGAPGGQQLPTPDRKVVYLVAGRAESVQQRPPGAPRAALDLPGSAPESPAPQQASAPVTQQVGTRVADEQGGDDPSSGDQAGDNQSGRVQTGDNQAGDDQAGDDQNGEDQDGDDKDGEDHRDWAWVEEWRSGQEPTPWATGLVLAAFSALVVGVAIWVLCAGLADRPVIAVLINVLVAAGLSPAIWLSKDLPVLRWIAAGAALGVVGGWLAAILMLPMPLP
ncbi:MAG: DUF2537 domain-containing protein [Nakamurella sp.]